MTSQLPPPSHNQSHALQRVLRHALRHDFLSYLRYVFHVLNPGQPYVSNWHIEAIAHYLNALEACELKRLIINMPPRSLKSLSTTVAWTSYVLGRAPQSRIITASYSSAISLKHATDVRSLITMPWYQHAFPEFSLLAGQNEKHKFMTDKHGFRLATSVGGTLTGEGGDLIIMDDPLNPAQAMSRTQRDAANHWFDHTLATRLNDKINGRMLLVMQRLHADDLSGHLLEKGGWEHLCLPAKAEADVLIDMGDYRYLMEAGALLQPLRETEAVLEQLRLDLGSMAYSAQYLQAPVAESGNLIHRDWLHEAASPARESCEMLIQSWDTAIKTGAAHDYSACATIAVRGQHYYVLDMVAVKQDYPTLKRTIISHYQDYQPDAVLIEDKASGQSLLQDLRGESSMPLIAIMPKGDELYRAARMTPLLEAGLVSFPYHAAWKDACMSELVQFPNGAHDDQVDALMQGLHWLHKKSGEAEFVRTL